MSNENPKKPLNKYIRFSGIAFQLGATIYLAAYLGKWLDTKYSTDKKWFTMGLILVAMIVSIWNIARQLKEIDKDS